MKTRILLIAGSVALLAGCSVSSTAPAGAGYSAATTYQYGPTNSPTPVAQVRTYSTPYGYQTTTTPAYNNNGYYQNGQPSAVTGNGY